MNPLKLLFRSAFLMAFALGTPVADAALVDCNPPERARFVVFLSEPEFTSAAFPKREEMLRFFNRLQEHLDQGRDLEMAEIRDIDFRVARCEKRIPAIDGHEFTDAVVSSMYGRKVVVEIWGNLDAKKVGSRVNLNAQINYLLVPIKYGSVQGSDKVAGIHRFNYPDGEIVATDFVDLISNADLHAFVAAAIGVMAFDGDDFALAYQMSCKASANLARTERRLAAIAATKPQSAKIRELRDFLKGLASRAIVEVRKKPAMSGNLARLQDPKNPCPD